MTRNLLLLGVSNTTSYFGNWIFKLLTTYLIWELTKSAILTSLIALAEFGPNIILSPIGGALADRSKLKLASYIYSGVLALVSVIAALLVYMDISDSVTVWLLLALVAFNSGVGSFSRPIHQKIMGFAFSKEKIGSALNLNSISFNITKFSAPLLTGIIIYAEAYSIGYLINAVSFLATALATYKYEYDREPVTSSDKNNSLIKDISGAIQYISNDKNFRFLFALAIAGTIFSRSIYDILPVLTEYLLDSDSRKFVVISSALGLFSVLAGFLNHYLKDETIGTPMKFSMLGILFISMNGLLSNFYSTVVFLGLSSLCFVISGLNTVSFIHKNCLEEQKGKVLSFYYLVLFGGSSLGVILYGSIVELDLKGLIWFVPLVGFFALKYYPIKEIRNAKNSNT